jgi:parallel beta-helix repeat protein
MRRTAVVAGLAVVLGSFAGTARAAPDVLHVYPGPEAITKAIAKADPGDTLKIHPGRYKERVIVDKRLRLIAARGPRPVIDAGCSTLAALDVVAGGVRIRGLKVVGGTYFAVDVSFANNVRVRDTRTRDTCGNAEYGVNVYQARNVTVAGGRARGFSDAGIYVGNIDDGTIVVRNNDLFQNNRGIIIQAVPPGIAHVVGNRAHDNTAAGLGPPTGIWLNEADGVLVWDNVVLDNGVYGIHLEGSGSSSDDNVVRDNVALGNGDLDVLDEGSGNCFSNNTVGTSDPAPLPEC